MRMRLESVEGNRHFILQGQEVLARLTDQAYAEVTSPFGGSPIGAHFRHVLDHYRSFFRGLPARRIDYDARDRDQDLERHRSVAITTCGELLAALDALTAEQCRRPVEVSVRTLNGDDDGPDWSSSTVKRELQFLVSHTVHHYALIKEILRQAGFDAGYDFGVAPSTLQHLKQAAGCAR